MQYGTIYRQKQTLVTRRERLAARNRIMAARYYYWTEIRRRRFDDVLRILSFEEFFVEDRTICNAISRCGDYISKLCSQRMRGRDLEREYPSWNWRTPA